MADLKEESHVSECDVDFSTNSPVISFDAVCLGHSNVASSEAYLEDELRQIVSAPVWLLPVVWERATLVSLPSPTSSGCVTPAGMVPLSPSPIVGGYYVKPTEVFGPGSFTNTAMFTSTGNNFGAGTIQFKDYQAENYVVLNAKFSYDPTNAAYQAADVLEIYVPDLSINRSAVAGVILTFQDRYVYSSYTWNNDGGTAIKSWIKTRIPSAWRVHQL
jgi:hypothetical protein